MRPYTDAEIHELYWGPLDPATGQRAGRPQPTPIPRPGQVVGYRHEPSGPVVPATVLDVEMADRDDPNVWLPNGMLRPDPAPLLTLEWQTTDSRSAPITQRQQTREARVPGQPGWLWHDQIAAAAAADTTPRAGLVAVPQAADTPSYLIVTTPDGRHVYPIGIYPPPDDTAGQTRVAAHVTAAVAAHQLPDGWVDTDGWDLLITHGEPHPSLAAVATRHDHPPTHPATPGGRSAGRPARRGQDT